MRATGPGPDKWGELDAANKVCSIGGQQSPINIGETIKAQLQPLKIAWGKSAESILNNGNTIQVNMPEGSTMSAGGGGLPPPAIPFPPPERAHDQRREFSDGGAFRPSPMRRAISRSSAC